MTGFFQRPDSQPQTADRVTGLTGWNHGEKMEGFQRIALNRTRFPGVITRGGSEKSGMGMA